MQQITVELIETKEFQIKPRGYDQQEVDGFLDDICDEIERLQGEISDLQQQLADAMAAAGRTAAYVRTDAPTQAVPVVKPAQAPAEDFQEILLMAQKVKSETIAEAERKAAEITQKAQEAADAKLQDLSGQRDTLQKEIASLKAAAADYRKRFEALLQSQQEAMEKATELF